MAEVGICGNLFEDKRFFKRPGTFSGRESKIEVGAWPAAH